MKLSTKIKKYVNPFCLWSNGTESDIVDREIVLMVDLGFASDEYNKLRTHSLETADEYHRYLTKDEHCTLLPLNECPVVNETQIIMHYTTTTYGKWCNLLNRYRVKPEYIDAWYGDATTEEIEAAQANGMNIKDIRNLAKDWSVSVDELMDQVEEM